MGEEIAEEPTPLAPPPAPSLDLPPEPSSVPVPSDQPPAAPPQPSGAPGKPKLSLKPKGNKPGLGGKTGQTNLIPKIRQKETRRTKTYKTSDEATFRLGFHIRFRIDLVGFHFFNIFVSLWGRSSVGRAPQWHCGGRRFDPDRLHQHPHLNSLQSGI